MKKLYLILCFIVPILAFGQSEPDPQIGFDNIRISAGKIFSNVENKEAGIGLGFSTEVTLYKNFLATSADFDFKTKKFPSLTFDYGAALSQYISDNMDMFIGISAFSLNLNTYGGFPFNSSFLLKIRYQQLIFESKTTFWNWQKGRDHVLKENGYYGVCYMLENGVTAGLQCRLYAKDANFFNAHIGYWF